jgi:DNA transformation protein and related proteins
VIFALILRDTLYFKVDAENLASYHAEGSSPFRYQARGKTVEIGAYWRAPERLLDDMDAMVAWAGAALAAGRRAAANKKRHRAARR